MSESKKKNSGPKPLASTNTMSKSLMSLKDLANEIADNDLKSNEQGLLKNGDANNDKLSKPLQVDTGKGSISEIEMLIQQIKPLNSIKPPIGSTVSIRISKKCHRILSELKLDDDLCGCRYGDILEALLYSFIQRNRDELKRRAKERNSSF